MPWWRMCHTVQWREALCPWRLYFVVAVRRWRHVHKVRARHDVRAVCCSLQLHDVNTSICHVVEQGHFEGHAPIASSDRSNGFVTPDKLVYQGH